MKKFVYSLIVCFFFSLGLQGQSADTNQLQLDDTQKEQFMTIEKERKNAMMSIESLRKSNADSYATKRNQIMTNADNKIKAILNQEQWAMYERIIKERNDLYKKLK